MNDEEIENEFDEILLDHSFASNFNPNTANDKDKEKIQNILLKYAPKTVSMYQKVPSKVFKQQLKTEFINSLKKGIFITRQDLDQYDIYDYNNINKNKIYEYDVILLKLVDGKLIEISEDGSEINEDINNDKKNIF